MDEYAGADCGSARFAPLGWRGRFDRPFPGGLRAALLAVERRGRLVRFGRGRFGIGLGDARRRRFPELGQQPVKRHQGAGVAQDVAERLRRRQGLKSLDKLVAAVAQGLAVGVFVCLVHVHKPTPRPAGGDKLPACRPMTPPLTCLTGCKWRE